MENRPVFLPAFTYGVLISIVLVLFKLILYLTGVDDQSSWQLIYYVILALGLLYSMKTIRDKRLDGFMTFGKAFMVGFYAVVAISIIMAIYTYLYMTVINPGMVADMLSQAEDKILEANPDMSDEDIQKALDAARMFMKPGIMAFSSLIMTMITGSLLSLVAAAFAKKKKVEVEI